MTKILYLVHDVCDPAVRRRVSMLEAGGAQTLLAGFRRGGESVEMNGLAAAPVIFGQTADGAFPQRVGSVARTLLSRRLRALAAFAPNVILARNLEMLALARRLAASMRPRPRIVYEILDIHRLLLSRGVAGAMLRRLERRLAAGVDFVITSSPAFSDNYLVKVQGFERIRLVENKVLAIEGDAVAPSRLPVPSPAPRADAVRIGWFGALRCSRSLAILRELASAPGDAFEVTLRGRPAYREFADFDALVRDRPDLHFAGPYSYDELPAIYGAVDYVWAIDFFEEGLNSAWLLPNRIYEGCAHGAVPIALAGTETARFVQRHGIGLVCSAQDLQPSALARRLRETDVEPFRQALRQASPETFRAGRRQCRELVDALAGAADFPLMRAA